jgi:hypothetical protein
MSKWQIEAKDKLLSIFAECANFERVEIKGSLIEGSEIDIYSDIDMEIHMKYYTASDIPILMQILSERIGSVFGCEIHNNERSDLLRICFENGCGLI